MLFCICVRGETYMCPTEHYMTEVHYIWSMYSNYEQFYLFRKTDFAFPLRAFHIF